jgi:predicted O-methyltransferase YrrM
MGSRWFCRRCKERMQLEQELSLESPFIRKFAFGLMKAIGDPRAALSWVIRGNLAKDGVFSSQTYWFTGNLPRVPLSRVLRGIVELEVLLPRAFDRKVGKTAAISVEEACHLAAIARCVRAGKALEIGTSDGNTALLLAANLAADGEVVTVDLPPDFRAEQQMSLAYPEGELNLTPRDRLGQQYQGHPLAPRIRQVYGDSARLDWGMFGGPFDLIFIDGNHSEAYVRSDSQNALKHLSQGGVIVWHDYAMIPAVSKVVDHLAHEISNIKVYALEGTRLAIGLNSWNTNE